MKSAAALYSNIVFCDTDTSDLHHKIMLDATPDCIKIVTTDGILQSMNRAGCIALNVPFDSKFGMPWLSLLPPEVREDGQEAIRRASQGNTVSFTGKSRAPDGMVYWDNLLNPIMNVKGEVVGLLCVSRDVTQKARLEQDLRDALKREQVLAQEMRHRVKNAFAVVAGLIDMAEREARSEGTPFTPEALQDRLYSLARASDAVFDKNASPDGVQRPVDIRRVITSVLEPYIRRCELSGHGAFLDPSDVTSISLFLHELATNSVKYGALGADQGRVAINWAAQGKVIQLIWVERGGPKIMQPPSHQGFGTSMVDRVIRTANGEVQRQWSPEGLYITLSFPAFAPLPLSA